MTSTEIQAFNKKRAIALLGPDKAKQILESDDFNIKNNLFYADYYKLSDEAFLSLLYSNLKNKN